MNDVGYFLVKDIPNKSISQIREETRKTARGLKPRGGDENHKKRFGLMKFIPPFVIKILYEVSIFATSFLGIDIPVLGLEKDALGAIIISSVGSFKYKDAYTSFFGTVGQFILLTVNDPYEEVIVRDNKMEIATVMNVNCTIDHRYLYSGARGQSLV